MKVQGFILIDVDAAALNNAGVVSRAGIETLLKLKKSTKKEGCILMFQVKPGAIGGEILFKMILIGSCLQCFMTRTKE